MTCKKQQKPVLRENAGLQLDRNRGVAASIATFYFFLTVYG